MQMFGCSLERLILHSQPIFCFPWGVFLGKKRRRLKNGGEDAASVSDGYPDRVRDIPTRTASSLQQIADMQLLYIDN